MVGQNEGADHRQIALLIRQPVDFCIFFCRRILEAYFVTFRLINLQ